CHSAGPPGPRCAEPPAAFVGQGVRARRSAGLTGMSASGETTRALGPRIERADIERLRELTAAVASPLSEYRAANVYLFREVHKYRWADGPAPALKGRTYDDIGHLTPLAPLSRAELLELAAELGPEEVLFPLAATD